MNEISCDICKDLIPLVQDGVASGDAQDAVAAHAAHCAACSAVLEGGQPPAAPQIDDRRVLRTIRHKLSLAALALVVLGAVLGIGLSDGQGLFYNILIMPAIGALSYVALRKRAYLTPLALLLLGYVAPLLWRVLRGEDYAGPHIWVLIYCVLCALGILIAALLHYAFGKDGGKNEK